MILYTVATISSRENEDTRCVAICTSLDRAKEIIENNEGDIWEMSYRYVVIEELSSDCVYGIGCEGSIWYEWHGLEGWPGVGTRGYIPIPCPEQYKRIVGFGVG